MKDHELFEMVRRAVTDKQTVPHPADPRSFAERYTAQQLQRKKLQSHRSHQKMDFLMQKFSHLDTYIDLPQLLAAISLMRQQAPSPPQPHPLPLPASPKPKPTDGRALRFVLDNDRVDGVKEAAGEQGWGSELVKNNSCYNMDIAMGRVGEGTTNEAAFRLIQQFQENQHQFLQSEQETTIQETALNNEHKKMVTDFLHKVSSYLQIVLETQHKSKWGHKHTALRKTLPDYVALNKHAPTHSRPTHSRPTHSRPTHSRPNQPLPASPKQLPHIHCPPHQLVMTNTRYIESLKEQTKKVKGGHLLNRPKLEQSAFTESLASQAFSLQAEEQPSQLRENFTFRRRSVKQRIMRRLDRFIGQVDEESHCSRKENKYYHEEINKLEHQFKRIYGRYKRETLAGDKDIENLQKMAQELGRNPVRQAQRRGTMADTHPSASSLKEL